MPNVKRLQFQVTINAPSERVSELMLGPETYPEWTAPFAAGSYFEGSWSQGSRIKFLAPSGSGMVAEIAEHKPKEFIHSFRGRYCRVTDTRLRLETVRPVHERLQLLHVSPY